MKAMIAAILLLGTLALPAQASAADLQFTLNSDAGVLTFQLDESPTGDPGAVTDDYFGFWNVDASLDGAPITLELIQFWAGAPSRGGFDAHTPAMQFFSAGGPQLYSGTTYNPTFLVGSFETRTGELSIAPVAAGVPEPGTWALMILGFGVAGVALRRRNTLAA
jgi:hypothetical protein